MNNYVFEPGLLPSRFLFPEVYHRILGQKVLPDLDPWWFLCIDQESSLFWLETLKEQFPERSLVPFAKLSDSDDLACFDGSDTSGNPKVLYIHAYTSPGWEHRGEAADFEHWLQEAKADSEEYQAQLSS